MVVGCLYLPNGNPAPGPKFNYKLRWFERLTIYAKALLESGASAVLAGDFNVMPTDLDVYAPERWVDDALFRPEVRDAYRRLVEQGWADALRALHPDEPIYTGSSRQQHILHRWVDGRLLDRRAQIPKIIN
jgi:exodeoxyribonuclease-3